MGATERRAFRRTAILVVAAVLAASPRSSWNVEELFRAVSTDLALGYDDAVTAGRLEGVELSERLTDQPIEVLKAQGAGPGTMRALEKLRKRSASLQPPEQPVVMVNPTPSSAEVDDIFRGVAGYAGDWLRRLPDFSCTETTRFYVHRQQARQVPVVIGAGRRSQGTVEMSPRESDEKPGLEKTVVEELDYFQGKETYRTKLVKNGDARPPRTDAGEFLTRGELGSLLTEIFDPSTAARFQWDHWESFDGVKVAVLSWSVDRRHSRIQACCRAPAHERFSVGHSGLVYAEPDTGAIVRLVLRYADLEKSDSLEDARLVLDYGSFDIGGRQYRLPAKAVMTAQTGQLRQRNEIEFSAYRRFQTDSTITFVADGGNANAPGQTPASPPPAEKPSSRAVAQPDAVHDAARTINNADAEQRVQEGTALFGDGKLTEAAQAFRDALRLDPHVPGAHYGLGMVLAKTNDLDGAVTELREELKRQDSLASHNNLGTLLFRKGDLGGAAEQFRQAIDLDPYEPTAHRNLGEVLAKQGDLAGAVDEYGAASDLAPKDEAVKTRYDELLRLLKAPKPSAAAAGAEAAAVPPKQAEEPVIKVDVRQVLVPVVITDKEGHYVTGLKAADFQVFEDDVAQEISGFAVQTAAGSPVAETVAGSAPPPRPEEHQNALAAGDSQPRSTYFVCMDTLNTAAQEIPGIRNSLARLFAGEHDTASQYGVFAIGLAPAIIQEPTRDAAAAVAAIQNHAPQRPGMENQASAMDRFRRQVDDYGAQCGASPNTPPCPALARMLETQAGALREQEEHATARYLKQLEALVGALAAIPGRRTLVLISDGFSLTPGSEAQALMSVYIRGGDSRLSRLTSGIRDQFLGVLQRAAKNNVVVYTIDSRRLEGPGGPYSATTGAAVHSIDLQRETGAAALAHGDAIEQLANATGGVYYHNSNDLLAGLKRALADGREYYLLAYVPKNANPDGKFRAIRVEVKDRGLSVRFKPGYWATTR
jgi:VWFA-related protein